MTNGAGMPSHPYETDGITDLLSIRRHQDLGFRWSHVTADGLDRHRLSTWTAAYIAERRCGGAPQLFAAWRARVKGGSPHPGDIRAQLEAFVASDSIGTPQNPAIDQHLHGFVAEHLWYAIATQTWLPSGVAVRVEEPHFSVTDSGGDGLAVFIDDDGLLHFRLWETKAHTGRRKVRQTVNGACRQVDNHAIRYLAKFSKVGQDLQDPTLAEFYGHLTQMWVDSDSRAGAGIAVAAGESSDASNCFDRLPRYWSFSDSTQREGLLVIVDNYAEFASEVREHLWKGL